MNQARATAASRQQEIDALCAASIRAFTGDPGLHFRGRRLYRDDQALGLLASHLYPAPGVDDLQSFRGAADAMSLRLACSNATLHQQLAPAEPLQRLLFELLEQYRAESLVPSAMPGMRDNLQHRHRAWSHDFLGSSLAETQRGVLLYAAAQIARSRVTGEPVEEANEGLIESTRMALAPRLGFALAGLRRHRRDQAAYAPYALDMARIVADMLTQNAADPSGDERQELDDEDAAAERFQFWKLFGEVEGLDAMPAAPPGERLADVPTNDGYRVFDRSHDVEIAAGSLVRPALLHELRQRLDALIERQAVPVACLARQLQAMLSSPHTDDWDSAQEEGRLDGRRLARLVTSPADRRIFRAERQVQRADCAWTFLVDCSGSMKQHAEPVAALVDVFARALDRAGLPSEVLGFTTAAWNGGRARRAWNRAGRPAGPGRLNELCHMVFKDFATSWRRARPDIAALLKTDLYREGVDGEAVQWASARLRGQEARRRILVVISDGSPMDGATQQANKPNYLDQHLREVIRQGAASGKVEIVALGIGLDLSFFYRRSRALDLSARLGDAAVRDVLQLVGQRSTR